MDLILLKKIMKMVDESSINDLELETEGIKIKLSKGAQSPISQYPLQMYQQMPTNSQQPPITIATAVNIDASTDNDEELQEGYYEIKSPIVGTFYKASSPELSAFVEVGSRVAPGSTLCIVEAMKLMNEIESDVSGEIIKILAENGKPVEYNQPLFLIKLD